MSLQIPISGHLFSTDQLEEVVAKTLPKIPPGRQGAIAATVDLHGAEVALRLEKDTTFGHWEAKAAYTHQWSGDNVVAGDVMFAWGSD